MPRRGLVIGCKYSGDDKLQGPEYDAQRIVAYLTEQAGWNSKDLVVMTQDQKNNKLVPTKNNIVTQIKALVEFAKKNSNAQLWFSFSGHGFNAPDKSGDETDGYDEIIWTSDRKDLTDDEFYSLFVSKLPSGTNAFVLIDSCNSGTFSDLPYILRSKDGKFKAASNVDKKTKANILCHSTCRDNQTSEDSFDPEDGKPAGLGTSTLLMYLQTITDQTPLNILLNQIVTYLKNDKQEPVFTSGYKIDPENNLNQLGFSFLLPVGQQRSVALKTVVDPEAPAPEVPVPQTQVPVSSGHKGCLSCFNSQ